MPKKKQTVTMKSQQSLIKKLNDSGTKVKQVRARKTNLQGGAKNRNQAYTSGGANNQGYDYETKQFTKGTSQTRSGRMAVEGETNAANARTWTMTQKDDDGNVIRQSGRSQTAKRAERYYDRRVGYYKQYQSGVGAELKARLQQSGTTRSLGFTIG